MEDQADSWKCRPNTRATEYRGKIDAHIAELRTRSARGPEWIISCMHTDRPLDDGLREYLNIRQGRK